MHPLPFFKSKNVPWFWKKKFFIMSAILIVCQVVDYRSVLKLSCRSIAFPSCKAFLKKQKVSGASLLASFSAWFLKKIFFMLYYSTWRNFIVWLFLLCEILSKMCIVIVCWPGCDVIKSEIYLIVLIKSFSSQKFKYLEKEKIEIIFHYFKGFLLKQIKLFFWKVRVRLQQNLYRSALILRNLPCPGKCLVLGLYQ